jgi:hypothetical protein
VNDWKWSSYDLWPEPVQTLAQQATPLYRLEHPIPAPQAREEDDLWAEVISRLERIIETLQERL